jgi:nucleoside triphosphate diphosphatase
MPTDSPAPGRLPTPEAAPSPAGNEFSRLVEIMRLLRSADGCPWDREQTLASLAPFVLEEAHEVVDAIERDDLDELRGEIGDLIFEGVFLAQVASDRGAFDAASAVRSVADKLVRRHPHVFESPSGSTAAEVRTPGQVVAQWDQIKAQEREAAGKPAPGPMDGLSRSLPSLLAAYEIGRRAETVRFDWERASDVLDKIEEEVAELRRAVEGEGRERTAEEMGDLLFTLAQLARKLQVEPEAALRAANRKFLDRFARLDALVAASGRSWGAMTLEEMERLWQRVKRDENLPGS